MERLIEIGVMEGNGQWDYFHNNRIYHGSHAFNKWLKSLHSSSYGRHWREETTFVDRNYHGN